MENLPDTQNNPFVNLFSFKCSRSARHFEANQTSINQFLNGLVKSYKRTDAGKGILRQLQNYSNKFGPIKVRVGALAIKSGLADKARVLDLMKRIRVGGLAIFGTIYLTADFFAKARTNRIYTRLLFSHELIHVLYRHDFPRMTLTTEAWAYWHEYKLFMEWQAAGIIPENLLPHGGAKRGNRIHLTLEEDLKNNPGSPFWKPHLVNDLVGSSYDWYRGFGRIRKKFIQILAWLRGNKSTSKW